MPATGHRVARRDGQVHDHLLQLAAVGAHVGLTLLGDDQLDVRADQAPQHVGDVADRGVDVELTRLCHLLPAERQQLPRQLRRAGGRLDDLLDVAALIGLGQLVDQEMRIAQDRRQQVVEVMGDPAGEPSDRLHLLRLPQLRFERVLRADVGRDAEQPAPGGVIHHVSDAPQPADTAIGQRHAKLRREAAAAVGGGSHHPRNGGGIVGMDRAQALAKRAGQLVA